MPVSFEWDSNKAASNLRTHGVAFEEACTVFGDPLAAIFDDEEHDHKCPESNEERKNGL